MSITIQRESTKTIRINTEYEHYSTDSSKTLPNLKKKYPLSEVGNEFSFILTKQEALEDISYAITEDDKEVYYAIRAKIYDTFEEDSVNAVLNLKIAGEKYWPEEFKSKVFINE